MPICPDGITMSPASIIGCRTDMAPLQKKKALSSSGLPPNSSTFHGFTSAKRCFRPATTDSACCTPTLKLSKVA